MALHADDWKAISDVLIDRVEKSVDERIDRIESTLATNAAYQTKQLRDHEERIAGLEAVKRKALFVWGALVFAVTFVTKLIWDEWLGPIITGKK